MRHPSASENAAEDLLFRAVKAESSARFARIRMTPVRLLAIDNDYGLITSNALDGTRASVAELVVAPTRVGRAAHEPAGPVVGDEHSVAHHRPKNRADRWRERRRVVARLEPHAHSHRRQRAARVAARVVPRRRDVCFPRARTRKAQRVIDRVLLRRLIVPNETGKIGSPAASADVQPAGRSAFELRSKIAPEPACHDAPPFNGCASYNSYSFHASTSTTSTCRSPSDLGPPSIGALGGIGYGPWSLSSS